MLNIGLLNADLEDQPKVLHCIPRPKPGLGGCPELPLISQSLQPLVDDTHGKLGQGVPHSQPPVVVRVPPIPLALEEGHHFQLPPRRGGPPPLHTSRQKVGQGHQGIPRQVLDHLRGYRTHAAGHRAIEMAGKGGANLVRGERLKVHDGDGGGSLRASLLVKIQVPQERSELCRANRGHRVRVRVGVRVELARLVLQEVRECGAKLALRRLAASRESKRKQTRVRVNAAIALCGQLVCPLSGPAVLVEPRS